VKQNIQIISAPSILGLKPTGVEHLPDAVLKAGLIDNLKTVGAPIKIKTLNERYSNHRDKQTKCLNPEAVREFSIRLMECIEEQISKTNFPLVLGGDCSILIGIMPGLKRLGNYGLLFLDAHADFYEPEKSVTGELADMELGIITGRGPDILTDIDNLKPYVKDKNVIQIGQRDADEAKDHGSRDIQETEITVFDLPAIRAEGLDKVTGEAILQIHKLDIDGCWLHFDTDVINDEENPAVEYRLPGGLTFREVSHLLNALIKTKKMVGMSVTIYDPALDVTGDIAVKIADCISFGFRQE
jgi:arginase